MPFAEQQANGIRRSVSSFNSPWSSRRPLHESSIESSSKTLTASPARNRPLLGQRILHRIRGRGLRVRQLVTIRVESDSYVGVPQHLGNDLGVDVPRQQQQLPCPLSLLRQRILQTANGLRGRQRAGRCPITLTLPEAQEHYARDATAS